MDRVFPAHIRTKEHQQTVQTVKAHNEAVARYAGERLLPLGLQKPESLPGCCTIWEKQNRNLRITCMPPCKTQTA